MERFECLFCHETYGREAFFPFCPKCGEPLFCSSPSVPATREIRPERASSIEKFADFLPLESFRPELSLGEGATPLVALRHLGGKTGVRTIFAKNEGQNPTGSFKDRGTAVAVQKAAELGFRRIGTVSTGNMAASTAAYGARADLETLVLLKEGTSITSLRAAGIFGPKLVAVQGDYGRLFYESLRIGHDLGVYFMNSIDPYRMEGYKVTGFEIFLQLGRRAPRFVVVPLSSGGHLLGLMRAFEDLERERLITSYPTFVGVQADGCAPLVRAFETGALTYERLKKSWTIAHAISNPAPPGGNAVLKMIREHRGILLAVSDEEMLEAQRDLASAEGLFCQPESATTLAALARLAASGAIGEHDDAVLVLTGSGLKTPHILESQPLEVHQLTLEGLADGLKVLARPDQA